MWRSSEWQAMKIEFVIIRMGTELDQMLNHSHLSRATV